MRATLLFSMVLTFASVALAADAGFTDYLLGLSEPVTKDKVNQAKADIKKAGGKVIYEITLGMSGLAVSLPSDQFQTFQSKDYVDFIEQDQAIHAF